MTVSARRGRIGGAIVLLLLAAAFYLFSPRTPLEAARSYCLRAWEFRHANAFASAESRPSSHTTWIGVPLGLIANRFIASATTGDMFFAQNGRAVAQVLRVLWALLAACSAEAARRLLRDVLSAGAARPARFTRMAQVGLVLLSLVAPVLTVGVRDLLPSVPAALLLLLASRALLPERRGRIPRHLQAAFFSGILLAWFPFLWPAVLLLAAGLRLGREPWGRIAGAIGIAVVIGLVLEPSHLTRLAAAPARILLEWRHGGGWGRSEGGSLVRFVTLAFAVGPLACFYWFLGLVFGYAKGARSAALFAAGLWILLVLVPAASGAHWPGSAQWSVAPLLAVYSVASLGTWPMPDRRGIVTGLALLALLASVIPTRVEMERKASAAVGLEQHAWKELRDRAGPADLWLADRPLAPPSPDSTDAAFLDRGFLLPRDPRDPARYDFAYWPRWYAGFRWIAVSAARVRENLDRPEGSLPRVFYLALEAQAVLAKQRGNAEAGNGVRLYHVGDGSVWRRPLAEKELDAIPGGPDLTWFISQIGALYVEAGDLHTAALLFRRGTEWDPHASGLFNNLGAVYLRQGEFEEAARAFDTGLRQNPGSFELLFNYGQACARKELYERAERLFRQALTLRPEAAEVHYELGRVFAAQGKDDVARKAFLRYLEMEPNSPRRPQIEALLPFLKAGPSGATNAPSSGSPSGGSR